MARSEPQINAIISRERWFPVAEDLDNLGYFSSKNQECIEHISLQPNSPSVLSLKDFCLCLLGNSQGIFLLEETLGLEASPFWFSWYSAGSIIQCAHPSPTHVPAGRSVNLHTWDSAYRCSDILSNIPAKVRIFPWASGGCKISQH